VSYMHALESSFEGHTCPTWWYSQSAMTSLCKLQTRKSKLVSIALIFIIDVKITLFYVFLKINKTIYR